MTAITPALSTLAMRTHFLRIKSTVRSRAVAAVAGTLLTCTALAGVAAATTTDPTFKEFRDATVQDEEGTFIFDGDEPAFNEGDLHEFYDALYGEEKGHIETDPLGLVVNRVAGKDDKWSATAAMNITYCVSTVSFGLDYTKVVNAMNAAAAAWEAAAHVNFIHRSLQDTTCSKTSNVVFNVRKVVGAPYAARAFFPSTARAYREILVNSSALGTALAPWTTTGILRHELGHTLGFRHEHTRPQAGTCWEDNNWRALTSYDPASVMHYPQCHGTNTGDLVLTDKDRYGAQALYGAP